MNTNEPEISKEGQSRRDFFKTSATGLGVAAVVATGTAGVVCALNPAPKPKIEGSITQAVRRIKQTFLPTQASVRWDGEVKMWAVLDSNMKPVRHFTNGVMTDVVFKSKKVTKRLPGCGGGETINYAGIAEGMLKENSMGSNHVGYRNLKFKDGHFRSYEEKDIHSAPVVVLLPERHAIYKEAQA